MWRSWRPKSTLRGPAGPPATAARLQLSQAPLVIVASRALAMTRGRKQAEAMLFFLSLLFFSITTGRLCDPG